MLLRLLRLALAVVLLLAIALSAAAWWGWRELHRVRQEGGAATTFVIASGETGTSILRRLESLGRIADARLARAYLLLHNDPPLRTGEYRFDPAASTVEILELLIRGEVIQHPITVLEGWSRFETARHLAASGFGDEQRFLELMADGSLVSDLDPEATSLEGYLFPDTYAFSRGASETTIVRTLVDTFRQRWRSQVLPVTDGSNDPRALVTLASIVEAEASLDSERPLIAGVYAHRLRRNIALYADPTVIYALKLQGTWDGNLRRSDLQIDSPYNTYRYPGLPPGPICSPGLQSLLAAATPTETDYLYFVSRNDGSHVFASTLGEHNRNVERWQRQYWRDRWRNERSERLGE
jgi:UPF0755 protein